MFQTSYSRKLAALAAQEEKAEEQSTSLARLTQHTEEALVKLERALVGIDEKRIDAVEECRTTTVGNIDVLRNQLYTFAVGAKAEITETVGVIKSGKGVDGKGGSFGKGFRRQRWQGHRVVYGPQRGRSVETARGGVQDPVQALD